MTASKVAKAKITKIKKAVKAKRTSTAAKDRLDLVSR
jgi:hypothetical protein